VVKEGKGVAITLRPEDLAEHLGVIKFRDTKSEEKNEVGLAMGLAWTEAGGDVLQIEATVMQGKGRLTLTGKLGDVMQESGQAALSYVRSRAARWGLDSDFYRHLDIHIHVPEGAIPKDGPSAGITLATAAVSALTKIAVNRHIAMTGEITLRGKVLPIGGVKEKVLAAHRIGMETVILPRDNEKDLTEIPANIQQELSIRFIDTMDEVLDLALERKIEVPPELAPEAPAPSARPLETSVHDAEREPLTN
jgi:ATP-dependent Lon protease